MGWQDRDYNRGGGDRFVSGITGILCFSLPIGTWFGARVRLNFWLLLSLAGTLMRGLVSFDLPRAILQGAILVALLMIHDFGHRIFARWVGGQHDEFMLWPAGGMKMPQAPLEPWGQFVAHVGGIAANLVTFGIAQAGLALMANSPIPTLSGLWSSFGGMAGGALLTVHAWAIFSLLTVSYVSLGLVLVNLLPFYWFDGAFLLQSALWKFFGRYHATNATCITGMVIAVPLFLVFLAASPLGAVMWGLLFFDSFQRRRILLATGKDNIDSEVDYSLAAQSSQNPGKRRPSRWAKVARVKAQQEREEQAKIDAILAKVHEKGLHSLSYWEKRALRQATEKQRKRDMAERL